MGRNKKGQFTKGSKRSGGGGGRKRSGGGGGGKRRRRGGGAGGHGLSSKDVWIALGTATAISYLQGAAQKAKEKDPKAEPFLTKIPMISSIGRTATLAIVAYVGWRFGRIALLKPVAIGLAILAVAQLARRGFELYDDKKDAMVLSGGDDWALPSEQVAMSGTLTIDGDDADELAGLIEEMRAAA